MVQQVLVKVVPQAPEVQADLVVQEVHLFHQVVVVASLQSPLRNQVLTRRVLIYLKKP